MNHSTWDIYVSYVTHMCMMNGVAYMNDHSTWDIYMSHITHICMMNDVTHMNDHSTWDTYVSHVFETNQLYIAHGNFRWK